MKFSFTGQNGTKYSFNFFDVHHKKEEYYDAAVLVVTSMETDFFINEIYRPLISNAQSDKAFKTAKRNFQLYFHPDKTVNKGLTEEEKEQVDQTFPIFMEFIECLEKFYISPGTVLLNINQIELLELLITGCAAEYAATKFPNVCLQSPDAFNSMDDLNIHVVAQEKLDLLKNGLKKSSQPQEAVAATANKNVYEKPFLI